MSAENAALPPEDAPEVKSVVTRVANLALVSCACSAVASAYSSTKQSHPCVRSVCDAAEKGVKTLTAAAVSGAQPLLTRLEPQISTANELACKGLDKLEQKLPILQQPPERVMSPGGHGGTQCQAQSRPRLPCAVPSQVVAGTRELVSSTVARTLHTMVGTRVGRLLVTGMDTVLGKSEELVQRYLPRTTEEQVAPVGAEVAPGREVAPAEQQRRWQSYFIRVGSLSAKQRHRALRRSLGELQRARHSAQQVLAQLHHLIQLIEEGQRGTDGHRHSTREHLHHLWLEWSQQEAVPMEESEQRPGDGGARPAWRGGHPGIPVLCPLLPRPVGAGAGAEPGHGGTGTAGHCRAAGARGAAHAPALARGTLRPRAGGVSRGWHRGDGQVGGLCHRRGNAPGARCHPGLQPARSHQCHRTGAVPTRPPTAVNPNPAGDKGTMGSVPRRGTPLGTVACGGHSVCPSESGAPRGVPKPWECQDFMSWGWAWGVPDVTITAWSQHPVGDTGHSVAVHPPATTSHWDRSDHLHWASPAMATPEPATAQPKAEEQQSIGTRVANLPLVSSAYDMVSSAYTSTKESHPYVRSVCDAAEKGVKTLTAAAVSGAQPLLTRLEPQISTANEFACKGLDKLEEKLPILQQPPEKLISDTKLLVTSTVTGARDVLSSTVAGARDAVTSRVTGVVDMTKGAVQGGVELTRSAVSSGVSTVMGSAVGQMVASGVGSVLEKSEELVDHYLPMTDEELAKLATAVEGFEPEQQKQQQSYFVRLGSLSTKLQHRALQHSLGKLQSARHSSQDLLAQLQRALDLVEHLKQGMDQRLQGGQEKLQQMWLEWSKKQPGGAKDQVPPEAVESGTLAMLQGLTQQLQSSCQPLVSSLQGLPAGIQDKAGQVRHNVEELRAALASATSLQDVTGSVLARARAHAAKARQLMDELVEHVASNTPLTWLVGPFAPSSQRPVEMK
ncbi:uncharacterized protein [Pithys albifrons albifrons]|uniref:uncharacterized protein n=1 Tax=Pithys albifrons albifrons TaxID=3385563 RepID=UPI003A5D124C